METFNCITPVQLRFNDFDTLGHLNNSVYFQLFDLAKSDYFDRVRGEHMPWEHVPGIIANVNCDFLEPTLAGEPVAVRTRLARMGNKSFTLVQQLVDTATGRVKCSCQVVMVYIDLAAGKPAPVPTDWRQAMEAYDGPL